MASSMQSGSIQKTANQPTDATAFWLPDVVADGVHCEHTRDPPGQHAVYIPPGDHFRESYRAQTYSQFPRDVPMQPGILAAAGFYYTGYKDRVKCFSCGLAVENWMLGDDATDQRWHRSNCNFALGRDTSNVPSGLRLQQTLFDPGSRARTDMQFAGRVSNTSYRTVESSQNNTENNAMQAQDIPCNTGNPWTVPKEVRSHAAGECSAQNRSNLQDVANRRETFRRWPGHIRATPAQIAEAGFFYMGEGDKVKCWYCNGGLQQWEREDDPWIEHAKWFPRCEYLLRSKGQSFVDEVLCHFPNLAQRGNQITSQETAPPVPEATVALRLTTSEQRMENAMQSRPVMIALEMGFRLPVIRHVVQRKLATARTEFTTPGDLINTLLDAGEMPNDDNKNPADRGPTDTNIDTCILQAHQVSASIVTVQRADHVSQQCCCHSKRLEDLLLMLEAYLHKCRICGREAVIAFSPCGHLVACAECGRVLQTCPKCGRVATSHLKINH